MARSAVCGKAEVLAWGKPRDAAGDEPHQGWPGRTGSCTGCRNCRIGKRLELECMYATRTEWNRAPRGRIELGNSLWGSDAAGRRPGPGADPRVIHAGEMLGGAARGGDLAGTAKFTPEKFDFLPDKFSQCAADRPETSPLFRNGGAGSGRRNPDIGHVLLIHCRRSTSRDSLEAQFAVDPSMACPDTPSGPGGAPGGMLPTGRNVYKRIRDARTAEGMNRTTGPKPESDGERELLARFARMSGPPPSRILAQRRQDGAFWGVRADDGAPQRRTGAGRRAPSGPATPPTGVPDTRERSAARLTPA